MLNLFGYTGIASFVAAMAGAQVTHVDASKKAIGWARENQEMSGIADLPVRWIVDDAMKFVQREVRRGSRYDGIILDPPKFGRGPEWRGLGYLRAPAGDDAALPAAARRRCALPLPFRLFDPRLVHGDPRTHGGGTRRLCRARSNWASCSSARKAAGVRSRHRCFRGGPAMADNSPIAAPGAVKTITSLTNPTIKDIRALALPKNRKESGLFVTEGMKLVADAVEEDWPIKILVYGAKVAHHPVVRRVAQRAHARGGDVLEVSEAVLAKITRRDNPQMVVGVFEQRLTPKADDQAERDRRLGGAGRDQGPRQSRHHHPHRRRGRRRGRDPRRRHGRSVRRRGRARHDGLDLPHEARRAWASTNSSAWRKGWPGIVVGTHLSGKEDYRAVDYDRPVMLLMGNEQSGLNDALAAACDHLVKIPQVGPGRFAQPGDCYRRDAVRNPPRQAQARLRISLGQSRPPLPPPPACPARSRGSASLSSVRRHHSIS